MILLSGEFTFSTYFIVMLSNIKIGTKLNGGFLFMVFLLMVAVGAGWFGLYQLGNSLKELKRDSDVSILAAEAEVAAKAAEADSLRYVQFVEEKTYKSLTANNDTILEKAKAIESLSSRSEMRKMAGEIQELGDKFAKANKGIYDNVSARDKADEERRVTGQKVNKAIDDLKKHLQGIVDLKDDRRDKAVELLLYVQECSIQREKAGRLVRDVQIILDNPKRDKAEDDRAAAMGELFKNLEKVLDQPLDNDVKELAKALNEQCTVWADQGKVFKELVDAQHKFEDDSDTTSEKIVELTKNMSSSSNTQIETSVLNAGNLQTNFVYSLLIVAGIAVLLGIIIALTLTMNITTGLKESVSFLEMIAREGDLSHDIPPHRLAQQDEIGQLAVGVGAILTDYRSVENLARELAGGNWTVKHRAKSEKDAMNQNLIAMIDKINESLNEINQSVRQVATGANEVTSAAQSLSSGAQESAASLEEITASMGEISSQTKQNAASAANARDLAQKATDAASEGQHAMQRMNEAMERITRNSEEVQRVIKVIDDIAFQTNLLALNAAVEAARAGQHGKGFAVVAEEVRNLAARSAKAARETSELIATSGKEIERGGEVSAHTSEVLDTIVSQIKETTGLVAGIAVASNEQAQGVNQITIGLQQIDAVTQQNTASAEESASAANEMSGMASNLQNLVAQFKLRR